MKSNDVVVENRKAEARPRQLRHWPPNPKEFRFPPCASLDLQLSRLDTSDLVLSVLAFPLRPTPSLPYPVPSGNRRFPRSPCDRAGARTATSAYVVYLRRCARRLSDSERVCCLSILQLNRYPSFASLFRRHVCGLIAPRYRLSGAVFGKSPHDSRIPMPTHLSSKNT